MLIGRFYLLHLGWLDGRELRSRSCVSIKPPSKILDAAAKLPVQVADVPSERWRDLSGAGDAMLRVPMRERCHV